MTGQTYSPYRLSGRPLERPADFGPVRRSGLSQAILASEPAQAAPVRRGASTGTILVGRGLADPAARRWVVLGAIGIVSSLLLTVAVALLSSRGVASADVPQAETVRQSRVTLVREIGGVPRSPTPGTGTTAAAPAAPAEPSVLEKLAARAILAVNAARAQAGALPLARNGALDTSSALHAQYDGAGRGELPDARDAALRG